MLETLHGLVECRRCAADAVVGTHKGDEALVCPDCDSILVREI